MEKIIGAIAFLIIYTWFMLSFAVFAWIMFFGGKIKIKLYSPLRFWKRGGR